MSNHFFNPREMDRDVKDSLKSSFGSKSLLSFLAHLRPAYLCNDQQAFDYEKSLIPELSFGGKIEMRCNRVSVFILQRASTFYNLHLNVHNMVGSRKKSG